MFIWKKEFETGIEAIDNQHKKLIDIAARLYDLVKLDENVDCYDDITELLRELLDYTKYHFEYEEKLFGEKEYPVRDTFKHIGEHKIFVMEIEKTLNKNIDDNQRKVTKELIVFLTDWLINHILKIDMKYVDYIL